MEDYIEDYRYNNCFWKKSGQLYNHSDNKFYEYMSIGEIFQKMSNDIYRLSESFGDLKKLYKKPNEPEYTREKGINVIFYTIKLYTFFEFVVNKSSNPLIRNSLFNEIDKLDKSVQ